METEHLQNGTVNVTAAEKLQLGQIALPPAQQNRADVIKKILLFTGLPSGQGKADFYVPTGVINLAAPSATETSN